MKGHPYALYGAIKDRLKVVQDVRGYERRQNHSGVDSCYSTPGEDGNND